MRNKKVECPKGKWLVVDYPSCDDKPEYRQPILCRAKDIGKIVYGMWIIGDKQYGKFQDDSRSDDEEKFYTAYKLVKGAGISCNFPLNEGVPFFVKTSYPYDVNRTDISWEYAVNSYIDSYSHHREPETDALDNGMIYIKMPSGAETKSADGAAEEKFAGKPQILKGDIVRFIAGETGKEVVEVVTCEIEEGTSYTPAFSFNPFFNEVLAVYRFDGRDFKCVWESVGYQFDRFKRIIDEINKTQLTLSVKLKSVNEAMEKLAKEAGDDKHGSEKAD